MRKLRTRVVVSGTLLLMSFLSYLAALDLKYPSLSPLSTLFLFLSPWYALGDIFMANVMRWRSRTFWLAFFPYILFHYFLFSFLVVGELPIWGRIVGGIGVVSNLGGPQYFAYVDTFNPAIWFFIGRYEGSLTPFQTFIGLVVALLVAANVSLLTRAYRVIKRTKAKSLILLPLAGLFSATSCCLALPTILLLTLAASFTTLTSLILSLLSSPLYFGAIYYALPVVSAAALWANMRSLTLVVNKACRL